jgi:hypothetical protein
MKWSPRSLLRVSQSRPAQHRQFAARTRQAQGLAGQQAPGTAVKHGVIGFRIHHEPF